MLQSIRVPRLLEAGTIPGVSNRSVSWYLVSLQLAYEIKVCFGLIKSLEMAFFLYPACWSLGGVILPCAARL